MTYKHRGKQYVAVLSDVGGCGRIGIAEGLTNDTGGLGAVGAYKALANYTALGGLTYSFLTSGRLIRAFRARSSWSSDFHSIRRPSPHRWQP